MNRHVTALLPVAFMLSSCFVELGAGIHPVTEQVTTNPSDTSDAAALSLTTRIGFYLDLPLGPTGIGLGLGPSGGGATGVYGDLADMSLSSSVLRGDVVLPMTLFSSVPSLQTRLTATYSSLVENRVRYNGADEFVAGESSGSAFFLGASLGTRNWYGTLLGSIGYESVDQEIRALADLGAPVVKTRSHGLAIKFLYAWLPAYKFVNRITGTKSASSGSSCPGGYIEDHCDVDGNCRSRWVCP